MLDINYIRKNPEEVKKGMTAKNVDPSIIDKFLSVDNEWRELTASIDNLRAEQKKLGKDDKEKASKIKTSIKEKEAFLAEIEKNRDQLTHQIPNPPLASVIVGKDESENKVIREVGEKPKIDNLKDYVTLAENLDIIDIERAAKVSGSRFGYLKNAGAMLEFALIDLAVKTLIKENFIPIIPPVIVNEKSMWSMGYLDRGAEEIYHLEKDNLYLVGTAEQSVGAMHQNEIFTEKDLPKRYVGFSTCFRREAGSYGKDTRGILRVHQFDKIEMLGICKPEDSEKEHKFFLSFEEKLMQLLKIPYRVIDICSGDLGDPAAAKYDIEAWLPGQNKGKGEYRETHSTSNTTDFQARRLNIKYKKTGEQKPEFVHMLNGTAFAIGRTLIAIIENYQTPNGTILVPEVLQNYLGIKEIK